MPEIQLGSVADYELQVKALQDQLNQSEKLVAELIGEKLHLCNELQALKKQVREEIAEFQEKTHRGIDASVLILTEICNSQTSHWQKKENLRLACEVLKKFKIESNGFFSLPWENDS